MKLTEYKFGKIAIDDKQFAQDLIIWPNGEIEANWWRQKGHLLQKDDIPELLEASPEVVIIGTGYYGLMKIDKSFQKMLKENNIELIIHKTGKAVEVFNEKYKENKVLAAFHLTC